MRDKIIDATVEEFKQNGLKFTMNDLAKRLGISKKTIYTVFESKQAVLVAVADRYAADLNSMQEELEADVSLNVVQKLEKLLCALPEKYYNIGLSRIYELAEKYPKPYRHLMRSVNNGWEQAEKYLEKGMEEGLSLIHISKVLYFGIETAGVLDIDSELIMTFANGTVLQFDFRSKVDIKGICSNIQQYIL